MPQERRKLSRRNFSYYMRVMDETSGQLVGHLMEISTGGFKVDSSAAIAPNRDYRLRIELSDEVANKNFMIFLAKSRWCHPDNIDPTSFNIGFQITNMAPSDFEIFTKLFEKYGSGSSPQQRTNDYIWK